MSDGRGDRRAEERQNGGQTVRRDEGGERRASSEAEWTRGENVFGEEGSERTPSSQLTTLHVQSGQLCVWGGRHSKRRKKKAIATHH